MIGNILAGVLIVFSVVKILIIATSQKNGKFIGFDLSVLNDKDKKEFGNLVQNLLSNVTFFYGLATFVINLYTDFGIYVGIVLVILAFIQDYFFLTTVFPRQYDKMRGK